MTTRSSRVKPPRSSVTLSDVARLAQVSPTTVSFVLNEGDERNRHVSEATRTKVLEAMRILRFQPHSLARALSKGYSHEIVGITDMDLTPLGNEMNMALQQAFLQAGYTPVVYSVAGLAESQRKHLYQAIIERRPYAIVATPTCFSAEDAAHAYQAGIHAIISIGFAATTHPHTYSIMFPSTELGGIAAHHLLERGHRRLAIVQPEDAVYGTQITAFLQRLEGMQTALKGEADASLELLRLPLHPTEAEDVIRTRFQAANHPTGIYAFNDEYAALLLRALQRSDKQVPGDVAVVGTDNLAIGAFLLPSLTTISFAVADIGERVAQVLQDLSSSPPQEQFIPIRPQLIQRESS